MAKHLAKKAACLIGSAAVALSMTLGAFPVYADSAASAPELGPVTSKDVVYQIITDRFYDGDTSNNVPAGFDATLYDGTGQDLKLYQGGDWAGIIEKIPYLKGMGVTAVWISAPYENRDTEIIDYQSDGSLNRWTSFHGYHVRNYFATNKHFGTLNEFKELRDALHANGIKLVIDFVTNHTSREMNPTANNIPEDGKLYEPDRKEDGTFAFDENGEPYDYNGDGLVENLIADPQSDTNGWFHGLGDRGDDSSRYGYRYKDLGSLADFSQENQDVAAYLEQATLFWADMGVNGIRHDATLHMDAAFAKGLKDAVDSHNTITQFGEFFIGRPDPKYDEYVYFPKQTGINNLDFEFYRAASTTFGDFSTTMADFGNMLQYTQDDYDYENQAVTFLDNHDVTRFGYTQRSQKTYNAALATLLTSRGVPNIYYGTEQYVVPADGSDVSGRIFMQTDSSFDTDTTAYKLIGKLSELRQQNDAIAYGTTTIRYSNDDVLIYERKFYDDVILVAINRQPDKAYTIDNVETLLPEGEYVDFLGGMLNGENTPFRRAALIDCIALLQNAGGLPDVPRYLLNRLGEAESLLRLFLLEVPTRILYIAYDADGKPTFCAASSRVPQLLRSALWNTRKPAILTSGTLAAAGDFSHTEQLLGLAAYRPLRHFRADSPFNYKKKCLLYFPPRTRTRMDNRRMAEEIVRLVDACHGHALVLFTAYRQMAEVRALTDGQWPYPTYQAWRNGGKIIRQFKQSGNGVLFAAGSCWEGIDFPGDMVSLLIIPKLPFPIPDPVSDYERQKYLTLQEYIAVEIIPEMQKKLRQGFGRAIRTEQDSCVVAILDERAGIGGKYHDAALAALPTCPTTEKIEDVQPFIREQKRPDYFL